MQAYDKERRDDQPDDTDHKLHEKMSELIEIREELYRAKENATQSWLDSKPVIDELEKLQAGLASAKNRISMSNIVISELELELEAIGTEIKAKVEKESKAKEMIDELTNILEQKHKESEAIKQDADEERRARSKLKPVMRVKRQNLRTLQLMLRAIRIESEAFAASAADAIGYIKSSEMDRTVVRVGQREYYALKRRAKEETALAEWRISVSVEQKLAAGESKNFALSRLKELQRRKSKDEKIHEDVPIITEVEEEIESSEPQLNSGIGFPKARAQAIAKSKRKEQPRIRTSRKSKKKKLSIFSRLRSFLVRSIAKFFG